MTMQARAADITHLRFTLSDTVRIESLKLAVAPPFILVIPFLHLPPFLELIQQERLEEEGVHGCFFTVKATAPGSGEMVTGFKDLREGTRVKEKRIQVEVTAGPG